MWWCLKPTEFSFFSGRWYRMLNPGYWCVELPVSDIHTETYILKVSLNGRLHSELILVTE
jgi:hypothetical protein